MAEDAVLAATRGNSTANDTRKMVDLALETPGKTLKP